MGLNSQFDLLNGRLVRSRTEARGASLEANDLAASLARQPSAPVRNVALLGFGTVGRSVAKILCERPSSCLRLTHICNRHVDRKRVSWLPGDIRWTEKIEDVLSDEVDVLVEVVGGLEPAGEWVRSALLAGKSVVTANKQLIAHCGPELIELARKQGCHIGFGASVAGGVPVVSGLQEGLSGDRLYKVCGILNGTCNYILSKIEDGGLSFAAALSEAQGLGYAEADPSDDVEGFDARSKLAILAWVGLHSRVHPTEIACRPITKIEAVDFLYARELGCTIRQVSWAELKDGRLLAMVQPALVPLSSPLARVQGSQNLVMATGEYGGETVFSGYGAGGNPTAVAVVSDLIAISQAKSNGGQEHFASPEVRYPATGEFAAPRYVRFTVKDRPGIIASLAGVFAKHEISIEAVLQKPGYPKSRLPFVFTLEECSASALEQALQEISALEFLVQPALSLPFLGKEA